MYMIAGHAVSVKTRLGKAHSKALHSVIFTSFTETQRTFYQDFAAQQHINFPNNDKNNQV